MDAERSDKNQTWPGISDPTGSGCTTSNGSL